MNTKLEYMVVDADHSIGGFATREEARSFKRDLASSGIKSKIVQNVWTLNKQRIVR